LKPNNEHYDAVLSGDVDGICRTTGRIVFALRKGVIPKDLIALAIGVFGDIDTRLSPSYSRASAAGLINIERFSEFRGDAAAIHTDSSNPYQGFLELKNGKRLIRALSNPVRSYMAGFNYDRYRKLGNPCGFSRKYESEWIKAVPFFQQIGNHLNDTMPDVCMKMQKWCDDNKVRPHLTIGDTCLSTVAVNVNYESCFHYDRGDLEEGYSTLTVLSTGKGYEGGFLVLPKYRIAIDLEPGDILLNQSHVDLHGNTSISSKDPLSKRISFVTYLKKTLRHATNK
jgi:hypothetical protein